MYKVVSNYCNCHPETCCCDPWKVVDVDGNTLSSHYNKEDAEKLANLLNRK